MARFERLRDFSLRTHAQLMRFWMWFRIQFFRFWTALAVLAAYGYFWVNNPEYLTWWKRTTTYLVEKACELMPYPWGDRLESTLGNFGIWVQITLAILTFRSLVGLFLMMMRRRRRLRTGS